MIFKTQCLICHKAVEVEMDTDLFSQPVIDRALKATVCDECQNPEPKPVELRMPYNDD